MKKIAISQSNYIPWKGYFDLINSVDEFIIYDDMQYTKNDWRNRNKIKTASGVQWLTIPVRQKELHQCINETKIVNHIWQKKHWLSISQNYAKSKYYRVYAPLFESFYRENTLTSLSQINIKFILLINKILGIKTTIRLSSEFILANGKTERLVDLCKQCNATYYLSGPAAQDYLDVRLFKEENIEVDWIDYSDYLDYEQLYSPFDHQVSILDLIFNEGEDAKLYMKSYKKSIT